MIHNLTPVATQVYMDLQIDFIPKNSPAARGIKPVRPIWMDVQNGQIYPVFNVRKGSGEKGQLHLPERPAGGLPRRQQAQRVDRRPRRRARRDRGPPAPRRPAHRPVDAPPGRRVAKPACASKSSSKARRRCKARAPRGYGSNAHLFRSDAKYFEPAGAVSWDVAMTRHAPATGAVKIQRATRSGPARPTRPSAAPGGSRWGSWSPTWPTAAGRGSVQERGSTIPASRPTAICAENRNHGGGKTEPARPAQAARRRRRGRRADRHPRLQVRGRATSASPGRTATRRSSGAARRSRSATSRARERLYHSITSCKAPCNRKTGIAYPLADGQGPVRVEHARGARSPARAPTSGRRRPT